MDLDVGAEENSKLHFQIYVLMDNSSLISEVCLRLLKKSLTRAHALARREHFSHDRDQMKYPWEITTLWKSWARSSQGLRRDPKVLNRAVMQFRNQHHL